MKKQAKNNALINETSPYLLQHAHNPVNWYPWSKQALELARLEDKPILLSIGYSACHWCHVMAHESFEDEETAAVMNEHFINIKVDREERPDLDRIYQTAQQMLTQRSGGWPLTMVLSPDDQVPFFGGTYFPPQARFGLPAFRDLLLRVAELYQEDRQAIKKQNTAVVDALQRFQLPDQAYALALDPGPVLRGIEQMSGYFDPLHGGFGGAPKFPQTPVLELLLTVSAQAGPSQSGSAAGMLKLNLSKMAKGGIYDQLGGGFCRYAVDEYWLIPHFEKMLYDNGLLLFNYVQAWKLTGNELYRRVAHETAEWIIRDMQSSEGGYYSSLDADSEGEEGKFYVWDREQVRAVLSEQEYNIVARHYGLDKPANFEGRWHLYIDTGLDDIGRMLSEDLQSVGETLSSAKQKLLDVRNGRIWPGRDEKILTSWNALAIRGMSMAALRLGNDAFLYSAQKSLQFIHENMWKENRLIASYKDGKAHLNAYLDDYVFLIDALLTTLAVRWETKWMAFALDLATVLIQQFYDTEHGGFYFTSHDHETLLQRRRDFMDDATPAGNGIAVRVLLQLAHLSGEQQYLDAAEKTLRSAWQAIQEQPHAHASLLTALCDYTSPPAQVIIRGEDLECRHWQKQCYAATNDINLRIYAIPQAAPELPGLLAERKPADATIAYICEGFVCKQPVTALQKLISDLKQPAHQ